MACSRISRPRRWDAREVVGTVGASAIPIVLTFALVLVAWQVVFASNRDLVRARAWGELARRLLPFAAITVMAASLPLVQGPQVWWLPYAWALAFGVVLVVANFLSPRARDVMTNLEQYGALFMLVVFFLISGPLISFARVIGSGICAITAGFRCLG